MLSKKKIVKNLTPNIALKSGSLNLKGIFDTWSLFGWLFESLSVDTAPDVNGVVTVDVDWAIDDTIEPDCDDTVHCEPADVTVTPSTMLLLTDVCCCKIVSGSVCCNKSVWAGLENNSRKLK